jgi:Gpi18-like mannosyltransferase
MLKRFLVFIKNYKYPLFFFLGSRALILSVIQLSFWLLGNLRGSMYHPIFPKILVLDGLIQWDSGWYAIMAKEGYRILPNNIFNNLAFMPGYPLVIRLANIFINNVFVTGILVSNIAFLISLMIVFKLIDLLYGKQIARRSILLMAFSPFSVFFSAMYPESLFLLMAVLSFYFFYKKQWLMAGIFAGIAGVTKESGLIISFIQILFFLRQNKRSSFRHKDYVNFLSLTCGLIGPLILFTYLWVHFGSPLVFVKSHMVFSNIFVNGFSSMADSLNNFIKYRSVYHLLPFGLNILHLFIGVLSITAVIKYKLYPPLKYWSLASLIMIFSVWYVLGRLVLTVFPIYICWGIFFKKHPRLLWIALFGEIVLMSLISVFFSHSFWVS